MSQNTTKHDGRAVLFTVAELLVTSSPGNHQVCKTCKVGCKAFCFNWCLYSLDGTIVLAPRPIPQCHNTLLCLRPWPWPNNLHIWNWSVAPKDNNNKLSTSRLSKVITLHTVRYDHSHFAGNNSNNKNYYYYNYYYYHWHCHYHYWGTAAAAAAATTTTTSKSKVKSFPSHMGPWGGTDLRFL